jgi:hypothetical protein
VFLRRIAADGAAAPIEQVTRSPRFQAHPSIAVDPQDRVWLAWDEAGANWGKDWNRDDTWRGSTLYADRRVRVAVLESGQWKQPPADLAAFIPPGFRRFVQSPKLVVDGAGRLWLSVQIQTFSRTARADFWTGAGRWEHFLTRLDGGRWTPLIPVPRSGSRPEGRFELCPAPKGAWMVWANDNRPPIVAPGQRSGTYEIDAATFESAAAATAPALESFEEDAERDRRVHIRESGDVARMRSYRTSAEGVTYQIVRGDFHRHTELSGDGAGDGSLDDYFRYMIDAAQMDTGIIADHNAGGSEYSWWRTEKANDVFMIAGRFTPLFGYERSVNYPNGHRNVIFPQRGVRTLPIRSEEAKAQVNTGPILYPYLKQNRGVCISHSLATGQGTDFRDNDPEVEPVVEIYQGYHASYEYEGAPRADGGGYEGAMPHGPVYPLGFYWRALGKGYKLGTSASSDHISTHSSYTMIYTPGNARGEIVESLRKRRAYGATDNILIDYKATDAGGRTHMMGESFAAPAPPKLWVRVQGTARLRKVEIVKDGRFVYGQEPEGENTEFTFVDTASGKGTSYYYVRVIQMDRNLAWSSPIWVDYGN